MVVGFITTYAISAYHHPEVQNYIQSLGYHLVANSDSPSQAFHFFIGSQPSVGFP